VVNSRENEREISGIGASVEYPGTKSSFGAALAKAIAGALEELPSKGVLDSRVERRIEAMRSAVRSLHNVIARTGDGASFVQDEIGWSRDVLEVVVKRFANLQSRLDEIHPSYLGFRLDGSPTEFTTQVVLSAINEAFPQIGYIPDLPEFRFALEDLIYKWAQVGHVRGRRTADMCLKRELANCLRSKLRTEPTLFVQTTTRPTAALDTCLLIDFRPSLRSRIKEMLEKANLFERVLLPDTSSAAQMMAATYGVNMCVFGPSLAADKIKSLAVSLRAHKSLDECAMLAVQQRRFVAGPETIHAYVDYPSQQESFNRAIVIALINAHGGTLPSSKRSDPKTNVAVSLRNALESLSYPSGDSLRALEQLHRPSNWSHDLVDAVIDRWSKFETTLANVEIGNVNRSLDTQIVDNNFAQLREAVGKIFPESEKIRGMIKFREVLDELVRAWGYVAVRRGKATASACLKREVFNCFRLEMQ